MGPVIRLYTNCIKQIMQTSKGQQGWEWRSCRAASACWHKRAQCLLCPRFESFCKPTPNLFPLPISWYLTVLSKKDHKAPMPLGSIKCTESMDLFLFSNERLGGLDPIRCSRVWVGVGKVQMRDKKPTQLPNHFSPDQHTFGAWRPHTVHHADKGK